MSSINTNASAMTALQTLAATNKSLNTTQGRIATGFRVAEASDNAAYWSIATTMRSDNKALSTVQDSLGLGASKVDTAYTGMNKAIDTLNNIKVKLVAANGASAADKGKIDTEIKALQAQLKAYADGATFSGSNMLSVNTATGHATAGTADDIKIVSAFNRDAAGTASISTIDVKVNSIKLYDKSALDAGGALTTNANAGILDQARLKDGTRATTIQVPTLGAASAAGDSYSVATLTLKSGATTASDTQITDMLGAVEGALKEMTTAATNLGAAKSRIELQKSFTSSLMDSIDRGVGQLVDADMNKESTRLQALQVQQQLGIQALSIANGNSQSIMSLFRG
ncbi:flagellin [Aminobacter aminovorans]|uniref:flagellin N-terminal helical domain-containing protein n=1 Tax=Aminobacter aminovorans TaxID=83263 RepID=UPI00285EFEB1|nr:flagellin [Aminobacter aminovorans]MDR7221973.1 flagellin [Aminobacter aminovorans]